MKSQELKIQLQRINSIFTRSAEASSGNVELLAHWARYICVLSAGFLENSLQEIYSEFVQSAASEPVRNYAISSLSKIHNPKTNRFIEVAHSFKKSWGEDLTAFVDEGGRREAIDSIMHNRHQIAHGKTSGVTVARVREYLDKSVGVIEFIEKQCGL